MGRKNIKEQRRKDLLEAFKVVLAEHGFEGATMQSVANTANISPGLIHHNFKNKNEMLLELIKELEKQSQDRFVARKSENSDSLMAYFEATLKLNSRADLQSAKCWVGIFAEAVRNPTVLHAIKKILRNHLEIIDQGTTKKLTEKELSETKMQSILAFVVGSFVLGALAPRSSAAGFAFEGVQKLLKSFNKT